MPNFNWRPYAAFGILGLTLLSIFTLVVWDEATRLAQESLRDQSRAKAHIEYAEDRIDQNCLSLEGMALRDCIHQEIQSAQDHYRSESDLDAQQAMARFTRIMGYTGIAGLFLGVASVGLILATLWETRAGVEIMRKEQRPWLKIEFGVEGNLYERNGEIRGKILFEIKNIGTSPAILSNFLVTEVVCESGVMVNRASLDIDRKISREEEVISRNDFMRRVIFPNDSFRVLNDVTIPRHTVFPDKEWCQPLVILPCVYCASEGGDFFHTVVYRRMARVSADGNISAKMISRTDLTQGGDRLALIESHVISDKIK